MRWHEWEPWFGLGLGLYLVFVGIQTQRGRLRRVVAAMYWFPVRWGAQNLPFAAVPAGAAFIFITVGATIVDHAIAATFIVLGVVAFLVAVAIMVRPPDRLKPAWIKDCESRGLSGWEVLRGGSAGQKR